MDGFPMEYYRDLQNYYFSVKEAERQAPDEDEPDS
jgi:hypothetical protein